MDQTSAAPGAGADDFSRFLQEMGVGSDISQRKNSPQVMSPLPPPAAAGEIIFKKKNRHVKTNSQPIRVDTAELRREYQKAQDNAVLPQQQQRQPSSDTEQLFVTPNVLGPQQPTLVQQQMPPLMQQPSNHSMFTAREGASRESDKANVTANTIASNDEIEGSDPATHSGKQKRTAAALFTKRLPKMSLMRSAASGGGSSIGSSSPRPRSPSKDSSMTAFLRLGTRRALVSKLGLGSSSLSNQQGTNSGRRDSELSDAHTTNGEDDDFNPISVSSLGPPPAQQVLRKTSPHAQSSPVLSAAAAAVFSNGPLTSGSSAPSITESTSRPAVNMTIEVPREKTVSSVTDITPFMMAEKTNSASNPSSLGLEGPEAPAMRQQRLEKERALLKEDHALVELKMAKTLKGAVVIAKTAQQYAARNGRQENITNGASDEAIRLATLTLAANNERRLRQLREKVTALDVSTEKVVAHANRVRDTLLQQCKELVQHAEAIKGQIEVDMESLKQKELDYAKKNTTRENELAWLDEKVSNALVSKEKVFRDRLSEAEQKVTSLAQGNFENAEPSWLYLIMDHLMHSFFEVVLLGGGTILSLVSSIVVWLKSALPCFRNQKQSKSRRRKAG